MQCHRSRADLYTGLQRVRSGQMFGRRAGSDRTVGQGKDESVQVGG